MLSIALLGACAAHVSALAESLGTSARARGHQGVVVTTGTAAALPPALARFDLVLLAGLEAPAFAPGKDDPALPPGQGAADGLIRAALALGAVPYRVLYGTASERLAHGLHAVEGLLAPSAVHPAAAGSGSLKSRPWAWMCDTCSDPQCEHRLLTALLAQRDRPAGSPGVSPAQGRPY